MGEFPPFPKPSEPTMSDDVCCLLRKACDLSWLNLVIALSQDAVMVIALLWDLHDHVSLQQLKMQMDKEVGDQASWKLLFCRFCQYSGSNDQSYLNHIVCAYYCANYRCGKCLDAVFTSGQKLGKHMKNARALQWIWQRGNQPQA